MEPQQSVFLGVLRLTPISLRPWRTCCLRPPESRSGVASPRNPSSPPQDQILNSGSFSQVGLLP